MDGEEDEGKAAAGAVEGEDEDAAAAWCGAPLGWTPLMCGQEQEEEDPAAGS